MDKNGRSIGRVEVRNVSTIEARQYAIDVFASTVTPGTESFDPLVVAGVYVSPIEGT